MLKNSKMLLFLFYIYIYIYLCFICLFLAVFCLCCCEGFSLVVASGGYSPVAVQDLLIAVASPVVEHGLSWHAGFRSCAWAQQLWFWALKHRLNSCGAQAQLFLGMWDLLRPGIKPVTPILAGGFLSFEPPGTPSKILLNKRVRGDVPQRI